MPSPLTPAAPRLIAAAVVALGVAGCGGSSEPSTTHATVSVTLATLADKPARHKTKRGAYEHKLELAAIHRAATAGNYLVRGQARRKLVALTFDDGPGPTTSHIVKWLKAHDVPATFFLIGRAVDADPAMVRAELRDGFAIGDHTQTHPRLQSLGAAGQETEILGGVRAIKAATGRTVNLFRPPQGSFDDTTRQILHDAGLLMVLWTVDTHDYERPGTDKIVYTALSGARAGTVILMHDGGGDRGQTLAALPRIVHKLRLKGYRLVTVPRLLVSDPVDPDQPPPHSLAGG